MATLHAATTIEQRMFMVRDAQRHKVGNRARSQRLQARIPVKGLCSDPEDTQECDTRVDAYMTRLLNGHVHKRPIAALFPEQEFSKGGVTTEGPTRATRGRWQEWDGSCSTPIRL
jgi:hypothetical protein